MQALGITLTAGALSLAGLAACGSGSDPSAAVPPRLAQDHWHVAYGIWHCDHYLKPLHDVHGDRHGIHTHDDGLIHLHPTDASAAGVNAVLERFTDEVDVRLDDGAIVLPSGTSLRAGETCHTGSGGTVAARLAVYRWPPSPQGDANAEIITQELGAVALRDRDALAIVFAPEGADVPPPAGVYRLDNLSDVASFDSAAPDGADQQLRADGGAGRGPLSTTPEASTSTTTRPAGRSGPTLPAGTRDSLALWLVDATVPAEPDGSCPSGGEPAWTAPQTCYTPVEGGDRLGPEIVRSAKAKTRQDTGEWYLVMELTSAGLDRFNRLAASAMASGQPLAISFGGVVLTAPRVQSDHFEREVTVTGNFSEADAKALAKALS